MNELNLAIMLYLVTQGLDGGRAAMRLVPSTSIRHLLRAHGNCCCMSIVIVADEATRRMDISVTGSPVAHTSRANDVARFLDLANEGDTFGAFGIEAATGAVYYATTAAVDAMQSARSTNRTGRGWCRRWRETLTGQDPLRRGVTISSLRAAG